MVFVSVLIFFEGSVTGFCRREVSHKTCTSHTKINIIEEIVSHRVCQWHFKADGPPNMAGQSLAFRFLFVYGG